MAQYGFTEKGWKIEIYKKPRMMIEDLEKTLYLPESFNRSFPTAIRTLAHEIEGHILRHTNRGKLPLKLLRRRNTGRGEAMSEAAAVWVEEETMKRAYGMERGFRGVYHTIIKERLKGRSFKYCCQALINNGSEPKSAFTSTLRIFRAGRIPLDDNSPYVPNSEELAYHEPTAELLAQRGLDQLLFVPGIDIYSFRDLQRIGMLPLEAMQKPKFLFAQKALEFNPEAPTHP